MLAPAVLLIVLLIIAAGRYVVGTGKVDQAAGAAARAASLTGSAVDAEAAARQQATQSLTDAGITCQNTTVTVDTSGFAQPPGTPASVQVTVACTTSFADLSIPGLPGQRTVTASAASPIDTKQEGRR